MPLISYLPALALLAKANLIDTTTHGWVRDKQARVHVLPCPAADDQTWSITFNKATQSQYSVCWECCFKYTQNSKATSEQITHAQRVAMTAANIYKLDNQYWHAATKNIAQDLGYSIELWLKDQTRTGLHPVFDQEHARQFTQLKAIQHKYSEALKTEHDRALTEFSHFRSQYASKEYFNEKVPPQDVENHYHHTTWLHFELGKTTPSHILAYCDLDSLQTTTQGAIIKTTFGAVVNARTPATYVLAIGDDLPEQHMTALANLVRTNTHWDIQERTTVAKALQAAHT